MRHLSTLLILLSINISLIGQSVGVNLPAGTTANTMLDVNGGVSFREGTALTCANGVNNNIALANYSFYRITGPTAAFSITGFGNGTDGRVLTIVNASGQTLTLSHLTTSTAANQINTGGSATILPANGVATMLYNASLSQWIVSGTMGATSTFSTIGNGSLTDSIVVVNNGIPLRVRPADYIENYAWGIDGNSNTTDGTHFLGTTNNVPLSMRVNNEKAGRISSSGETFLGYQAGVLNSGVHNSFVGYQSGNSNTTGVLNVGFGSYALFGNTTGFQNTALGVSTLLNNTTGNDNTAVGHYALNFFVGTTNTAVGSSALKGQVGSNGSYNTAIGYKAAFSNTTGVNNVAVGDSALHNNTSGFQNVAIGNQAGFSNTTGYINQFIGDGAGFSNTTGWRNLAMGYQAGYHMTTGSGNILIGRFAGLSNTTNKLTGDKNTIIGDEAGKAITTGYQNVFMGDDAGFSTTTGYLNVALGQGALYTNLTGSSNVAIGRSAGGLATGSENTFVGGSSGFNTSTGIKNVYIGYGAASNATTGSQNTFLGYQAGLGNILATGSDNTFVGYWAGYNFTSGNTNVGIGRETMMNVSTGSNNTAVGYQAMLGNTSAWGNTALGSQALYSNLTGQTNVAVGDSALYFATASGNTTIGYRAGSNITTGTDNIAIGNNAQVPTATVSNQLSIGNWIYGVSGNIGLGLTAPSVKLHQDNGTATATYHKFTAGTTTGQTATDGFDVGTDASGNAVLNQKEALPLIMSANNAEVMRVTSAGNVLIGGNLTPGEVTGFALVNQSASDQKDDMIVTTYNSTTTPAFVIFKARGTAAAPTSLTNSETIGGFNANGYTGSAFTGLTAISTVTASDFTTSFGADIAFKTSRSGTSNERMRILSTGNVGIGVTAPSHILQINGQGRATSSAWATSSDSRLKDIDGKFEYGLKELLRINTVRFHYKKDNSLQLPTDKAFQGIIAQELQKVIPEAVTKMPDGYLTVSTDPVFWTMLNAIKELDAKVEALTKENTTLKAKVSDLDALKAEVEKIKKAIEIRN